MRDKQYTAAFFLLAIIALIIGLVFGLITGHEYVSPALLKEWLPFQRMREMHVAAVVSWIVLAALGGVYSYIGKESETGLRWPKLVGVHLLLFLITGIAIIFSVLSGNMGGREYLSFYPWLMIPIIFGWILFAVNYFATAKKTSRPWPVYQWMWGTGAIFMIYHLAESNLWVLPYFRERFVLDLTVQWKSYGSFVGSWNMLIYGTALYLMTKIQGNDAMARSKLAFFFYFLGFTNLLLGWAHHIYPVPSAQWIRILAYIISMTEWLVLAHLLYSWIKSNSAQSNGKHHLSYRLLLVTDIWIIANVFIALLISIPAINLFTHGTHITVAHSMGTTIGINTSILIASLYYAASEWMPCDWGKSKKILQIGQILFNLSLAVFLIALMILGYFRGQWMMFGEGLAFSEFFSSMNLFHQIFYYAGSTLAVSIVMLIWPAFSSLLKLIKQ